MTMHYYRLEHPTSEQWLRLLQWALARSHTVEFRYDNVRAPLPKPLRPFQSQLKASFVTCHFWGAKQLRPSRFIRLTLDDILRAFLLSRPSLSDWEALSPALTDPALYDGETAHLWTIAHEGMAFVAMDETEAKGWQSQGVPLTLAEGVELPIVKREVPCSRHSWDDRLTMILAVVILLGFLGMGYYMLEGFLRLLAR